MASKKRNQMIEVDEILEKLKKMGAREITDEDRQQPWYKEHLKQLERWREEEVGKPFTVREKEYFYGSSSKRSSRSKR
jgi:hypothetical protein